MNTFVFPILCARMLRLNPMAVLVGVLLVWPNAEATAACDPVAITNQPQSFVVLGSCQAAFSVGVSGSPPYSFQWWHEGQAIPDATNSVYITRPAILSDSGILFVTVNNACGEATSSNAA